MLLDYLAQVIKNHSYTVYSLAVSTGIERSYLSKILNGKRNMTTDIFYSIIHNLTLTADERRRLSELFIAESFGEENFNSYIGIFKMLGELSADKTNSNDSVQIVIKPDNDIHRCETEQDFFTVAKGIIFSELETDKKTKRIYTNISSIKMVDIMRKYPNRADVDFRQLICLDNSQPGPATILSEAICFIMMGYSCNYYTAETNPYSHSDNLFPYFLITDSFCLFADSEYKNGFWLRNPDMADIYAQKFLSSLQTTGDYVVSTTDIMQSKDFHHSMFKTTMEHFYTLGTNLCLCHHLTRDMWNQIARPDIPNREFLVDIVYEHYKLYWSNTKKITAICTRDSLEKFISDGIITQMPEEYIEPLTMENRINILLAFRKAFNDSNYNFHVLKNNVFNTEEDFEAELFDKLDSEGFGAISLAFKSSNAPMQFCGNSTFNVFDKNTAKDFIEFIKHLIASDLCYSKEESLALIDEAIQKASYSLK